ncbi:hypothetical protein ACOME3_000502 [Neoechinorhynchus agilis]
MIVAFFIVFLSFENTYGYKWYYDRANYTLFRSNKKVDLTKPRFQAINGDEVAFGRNRTLVRLIEFSESNKTYQGCTQKTPRCKERAHFNEELKLRINTPPCCRRNLILTYYDVLDVLEKFKFSYSLYGGSLLVYEEITCIPYDDDIDFIANSTEYDRFMAEAKPILEQKKGRKVKDVRARKQTHIQVSDKNKLSVDIFWFIDNGTSIDIQFNWLKFDKKMLFPTKPIVFENRSPQSPLKVKELMERLYKKWQYPLDCSIRRGHNCNGKYLFINDL